MVLHNLNWRNGVSWGHEVNFVTRPRTTLSNGFIANTIQLFTLIAPQT